MDIRYSKDLNLFIQKVTELKYNIYVDIVHRDLKPLSRFTFIFICIYCM